MATASPDFICVLRVTSRKRGLGPALRAHIERHPRWKPEGWWKPGDRNALGQVSRSYGFNVLVAEGEDWKKVRARMMRRLELLEPLVRACRKAGGLAGLDVAAMPGPRWFTRSVRLSPDDLRWLAKLGVDWEVTAYAVAVPGGRPARSATKRSRHRAPR